MKRTIPSLTFLFLLAGRGAAQSPEIKFISDTLVVQAEGTYEADPDLATLTFDISSQEKALKPAYDRATQSMQRIVALAERNGLRKEDVSSGVLTVTPYYERGRKQRARSYSVKGQIVLKVRDFSKIGPTLDRSVEDKITDLRSVTYSLTDEEAAKQRAVAVAMQRAEGRARMALDPRGQKVGGLKYANIDVKNLTGVVEVQPTVMERMRGVEVLSNSMFGHGAKAAPVAPLPPVAPGKITVSATVQCAFQIS